VEQGYLWIDRESVMLYNSMLPELDSILKENGPFMMSIEEPPEEDENKLLKLLERVKLEKKKNPEVEILSANETGSLDCQKICGRKEPVVKLEVSYMIGGNKDKLERLIKAGTHWNIGKALGYPIPSIRRYVQPSSGDMNKFQETLIKAAEDNIALPPWFAYMDWIPESENRILKGEFPNESKKVAKSYRGFLKREQPMLAEVIEWEFYRKIKLLQ
jgi:hypothetical protein